MATSDEHHRLTAMGAAWFRKNGFGVVGTELTCSKSRERPDVVAFRSECSAIIEVKVSRSDFRADKSKPERTSGGLGIYRFFLVPEGLVTPEEIPAKWGLLYAKSRAIETIVKPRGNLWPSLDPQHESIEASLAEWRAFQHVPDLVAERSALYSLARRFTTTKG